MTLLGWLCLVLAVWVFGRMLVSVRSALLVMGTPVALMLPGGDRRTLTRRALINIVSSMVQCVAFVLAGLALIGVLS